METEREFTFSEAEYNELMEQQMAERMKNLRRHKMPEKIGLHDALLALNKNELEDIQFNLNLPMAKNINRIKKDDMVAAIEPVVREFVGRWFVSAFEEQKELFDYACSKGGVLEDLQYEDYRLDYLRGIGVLFCGMQDGKMIWYMPTEIQEEYQKINNGAFADAVRLNSEVMRLAAGMVFYYGIINYDELYKKICDYIDDDDFAFTDFMGVVFNGGCWYPHVVTTQHDLMHESLMNPEALQTAQRQQVMGYADFPYDRLYEAGQDGYIESTEAYRALAQYFMKEKNLDVLQAAEAVKSITIIMQNGYGMKEIVGFLTDHKLEMEDATDKAQLHTLIGEYNADMPLWALKGYTPNQVATMPKPAVVREGRKIGRNEPCPCGSGKKYKNCCIGKEW